MASGLRQVLEHLQHAGGGLSDGQLLARFVAARDEASFAALVRRHGSMVLGVCRRVLHDFHDAEDAFQATFLVLARKAASVIKGESVGCWLHGVAYRTAREASELSARRRARERPMKDMPHPQIAPAEIEDWRPLLDRELNRLPEKYRAAVVLCDLEGHARRDAARLLGIPEGTLSSRLAAARKMLARRLAGCGVALPGGALAAMLSQGAASAQLPAALVSCTARAAALVAAGQLTAASAPAVVLMKGVMKAMLLKKLRLAVGTMMVVLALGALGLAYQAAVTAGAARAAPPDKPVSELDALRKENELLKLNLQIVLEKVRSQETELHAMRKDVAARDQAAKAVYVYPQFETMLRLNALQPNVTLSPSFVGNASLSPSFVGNANLVPFQGLGTVNRLDLAPYTYPTVDVNSLYNLVTKDPVSDAVKEAECAVKALREAKDKEGRKRAAEALDKAMKKLKEGLK